MKVGGKLRRACMMWSHDSSCACARAGVRFSAAAATRALCCWVVSTHTFVPRPSVPVCPALLNSALPCPSPLQVEVVTPEDHMGDVIGDLNSRRGIVQEFTDKPGGMKVCGGCWLWQLGRALQLLASWVDDGGRAGVGLRHDGACPTGHAAVPTSPDPHLLAPLAFPVPPVGQGQRASV